MHYEYYQLKNLLLISFIYKAARNQGVKIQ